MEDPKLRQELKAATAVLAGLTWTPEEISRVLGGLAVRESVDLPDVAGRSPQRRVERKVCSKVCNRVCNRACSKVCNRVCSKVCSKRLLD
jgi:hypothetical protein